MKLEKDDYDAWREHFLNALSGSAGDVNGGSMSPNNAAIHVVTFADAIARLDPLTFDVLTAARERRAA